MRSRQRRHRGSTKVYKFWDPVTGTVVYSDKVKRRWDGVWTTDEGWEPRHPQELPRKYPDPRPVYPISVEPAMTFVTGICPSYGVSGRAGVGVAGCMIAGLDVADDDDVPAGTFTVGPIE